MLTATSPVLENLLLDFVRNQGAEMFVFKSIIARVGLSFEGSELMIQLVLIVASLYLILTILNHRKILTLGKFTQNYKVSNCRKAIV